MSVDWSAHLEPGEELKWTGAPRVGKIAATQLEASVLICSWIMVVVLAVVGIEDAFALVCLLAFVPCASFVTWRVRADLHDQKMQAYAVTNLRVLMCYDIEDGRLYETRLTRKTCVSLIGRTVFVDARRSFLTGQVVAQGANSSRTRGLALHNLADPLEAVSAMRETVRALPKDA